MLMMGLFGGDAYTRELKDLRAKEAWDELAARAYREITPFSEVVEEIFRRDADALHGRTLGPLRGFAYGVMQNGFSAIMKSNEKNKYDKCPNVYALLREEGFMLFVNDKVNVSLAQLVNAPVAERLIRETREKFGAEIAKRTMTITQDQERDYKEREKKLLAEKVDYKAQGSTAVTLEDFAKAAQESLARIEEQVNKEFEELKGQLYESFQKLDSKKFFSTAKKIGLDMESTMLGHATGPFVRRLEEHKGIDSTIGSELIKAGIGKIESLYRQGRLFYDEARDKLLLFLRTVNGELETYSTSRGSNLVDTSADFLYKVLKNSSGELERYKREESDLKTMCVQIFDDALAQKGASQAPWQLEQPRDDKGFRNMYTNITFELQDLRGKISEETIGRDDAVKELERIRIEFVRMKDQDGEHKDVNRIDETITDTQNAIKDLL